MHFEATRIGDTDMKESLLATIFAYTDAEYVTEYIDGFVPNAYRWPAPGTRAHYFRDGREIRQGYDRKRSRGRGPWWVAFSEKGGRILSR